MLFLLAVHQFTKKVQLEILIFTPYCKKFHTLADGSPVSEWKKRKTLRRSRWITHRLFHKTPSAELLDTVVLREHPSQHLGGESEGDSLVPNRRGLLEVLLRPLLRVCGVWRSVSVSTTTLVRRVSFVRDPISPFSRKASGLCGRTRRTSAEADGSLISTGNSVQVIWTVFGWMW